MTDEYFESPGGWRRVRTIQAPCTFCKRYSKEHAYGLKVNCECSTHHNVVLVGHHRILLATLRNILGHGVFPVNYVREDSRTVSYIMAKGQSSVVLVKIQFRHNI